VHRLRRDRGRIHKNRAQRLCFGLYSDALWANGRFSIGAPQIVHHDAGRTDAARSSLVHTIHKACDDDERDTYLFIDIRSRDEVHV
jgi:hypothetical protein